MEAVYNFHFYELEIILKISVDRKVITNWYVRDR